MSAADQEIAAFYLIALRFKLLGGAAIVRWADSRMHSEPVPDEWLIDLSLSALRSFGGIEELLAQRAVSGRTTSELFAGLLHRRMTAGLLSGKTAAQYIYEFHRFASPDVENIFGSDIWCIDEVYEGWWLGETAEADAYVEAFLGRFRAVALPPID